MSITAKGQDHRSTDANQSKRSQRLGSIGGGGTASIEACEAALSFERTIDCIDPRLFERACDFLEKIERTFDRNLPNRAENGRVPSLVLVHGSGHTAESFAKQRSALAQVTAASLPGHPHGQALTTVDDCAVWLLQYIRSRGGGRPFVGGNSLGGAVALALGLRAPTEIGGLVVIGSGARLRVAPEIFTMIDTQWPACADTLAGQALAVTAPHELRQLVKSWTLQVGQQSTRADYAACDSFDVMQDVGGVTLPALVIVGAEDRMTPPKYASYLHGRMPHSELVIIQGAGHMPHLEQPDRTNHAIDDFLQRHGAP